MLAFPSGMCHGWHRPIRAIPDVTRVDEVVRLRERLDALGPAPRAELLHVLMLPDFDGADMIGSYWGNPKTRTFAELLIDCEEDRTLRAVLVGMLREEDRTLRAVLVGMLREADRGR